MKDQLQETFYQEGFTIDVPKKWTSIFSKTKTRTFSFKLPFACIQDKISNRVQKAGFRGLEIDDFEDLTKKQLWQAARIVGLNAGGSLSLFYAIYFYFHLESEKLGKLTYMVIMLNRLEFFEYVFSHFEEYIYANMSDQEKAALSGRWMYQ